MTYDQWKCRDPNDTGFYDMPEDDGPTELDIAYQRIEALVKALQDILTANVSFRASMPDDWEGDLLQDACDAARLLMRDSISTGTAPIANKVQKAVMVGGGAGGGGSTGPTFASTVPAVPPDGIPNAEQDPEAFEREIEAREECARRGLDPDDDAADGVTVWMVVDQEMRERRR